LISVDQKAGFLAAERRIYKGKPLSQVKRLGKTSETGGETGGENKPQNNPTRVASLVWRWGFASIKYKIKM